MDLSVCSVLSVFLTYRYWQNKMLNETTVKFCSFVIFWTECCPISAWQIRPEPERDSVIASPLLYMLMMCMKLRNLCINCSVLMSVIWFVLLLHIVMYNICLFERQLVLTNDLELPRPWHSHLICYTDSKISDAVQYFSQNRIQKTARYPANQKWISGTFLLVTVIMFYIALGGSVCLRLM